MRNIFFPHYLSGEPIFHYSLRKAAVFLADQKLATLTFGSYI